MSNKISSKKSFAFDIYRIDAPLNEYNNLIEFSELEYSYIPKIFQNEKNFNSPPVFFLDHEWNVQLGTVNNHIYKIAPYFLAHSKDEANVIAMQILNFCMQELGEPSEQKTGLFIWNTIDGNTILQTAEVAEGWSISLFITSSKVKNFSAFSG